MNVLPFETQVRVISALTEGCSIRSTERLLQVHRDSIMRLSVRVGEGCTRLHDRMMRDLQVNLIELDEQWDFIAKKQRHVKQGDREECGDVWLFVALAATQKAVLSYLVGKRTAENTEALTMDLRARIVNRPQITSDAMRHTSEQSKPRLASTSISLSSRKNMSAIPACRTRRIAIRRVMSLA